MLGEPTATEVIQAIQEAVDRSGGSWVIYIHPEREAVAAIVVRDDKDGNMTEAWKALHDGELTMPNQMYPHDHIEPGMF